MNRSKFGGLVEEGAGQSRKRWSKRGISCGFFDDTAKPCNVGNWKGFGRGLSCNRYCTIIYLENKKIS
jgi:hypothetical protein